MVTAPSKKISVIVMIFKKLLLFFNSIIVFSVSVLSNNQRCNLKFSNMGKCSGQRILCSVASL